MSSISIQSILANLSSNSQVQKILSHFNQLSGDLQKMESQLKDRFDQEKSEKITLALKKYKALLKTLNTSEKSLKKEVNTAIAQIRKSAVQIEKNIQAYRKKAVVQTSQIEKTLFAAKKKKATVKKTSKKVTKKAATVRKTSKKATSKKQA